MPDRIENYHQIVRRLTGGETGKAGKERVLSVGAACDRDLLESVSQASGAAGIEALLYGDAQGIERILSEMSFNGKATVTDVKDGVEATRAAVRAVREGRADVLMKGQVNTSDFMRAVLDAEIGLRTGRQLSHLASFEVAGMNRLLFVTDGGISIAPGLAEKKEILINALLALKALGYASPKVAVLTANEQVNPKAPSTVDAAEIAAAWRAGEFAQYSPDCIVEGPMALDVALSKEAAEHKGLKSEIAGETDLFLVSSIEVGNVLGKSMANIARAKMAGVVLGASAPIVLTSRAESAESKLNSIVLATACAA